MRFWNFWNFFKKILGYFSKLLRLLLKVTVVTTGHQKWPKVSQNSIKSLFFARWEKKPLPWCSGLYLLVVVNSVKYSVSIKCSVVKSVVMIVA